MQPSVLYIYGFMKIDSVYLLFYKKMGILNNCTLGCGSALNGCPERTVIFARRGDYGHGMNDNMKIDPYWNLFEHLLFPDSLNRCYNYS